MTTDTDTTVRQRSIESPLGALRLLATADALLGVYFDAPSDGRQAHGPAPAPAAAPGSHALLDQAAAELHAYFDGSRHVFELPLAPRGSPFQLEVWAALARIPFGETRSYAELARAIERPRAVRAVGAANARNPLSLIVPCHRVIGSDGSLTGYAGGVERKRWLLAHESTQLQLV